MNEVTEGKFATFPHTISYSLNDIIFSILKYARSPGYALPEQYLRLLLQNSWNPLIIFFDTQSTSQILEWILKCWSLEPSVNPISSHTVLEMFAYYNRKANAKKNARADSDAPLRLSLGILHTVIAPKFSEHSKTSVFWGLSTHPFGSGRAEVCDPRSIRKSR